MKWVHYWELLCDQHLWILNGIFDVNDVDLEVYTRIFLFWHLIINLDKNIPWIPDEIQNFLFRFICQI